MEQNRWENITENKSEETETMRIEIHKMVEGDCPDTLYAKTNA